MGFENNGNEFLFLLFLGKHGSKSSNWFWISIVFEVSLGLHFMIIIQVFIANYSAPPPLPECRQPRWWVLWWVIVRRGASALYQFDYIFQYVVPRNIY